jgi:hypothetical protein
VGGQTPAVDRPKMIGLAIGIGVAVGLVAVVIAVLVMKH